MSVNRYYGKTTRNAIRDMKAVTEKATAENDLTKGSFYAG